MKVGNHEPQEGSRNAEISRGKSARSKGARLSPLGKSDGGGGGGGGGGVVRCCWFFSSCVCSTCRGEVATKKKKHSEPHRHGHGKLKRQLQLWEILGQCFCLGFHLGQPNHNHNQKFSEKLFVSSDGTLSGPLRLRVQSRSRTRLRIAASIAFLFRACFKGVLSTIAPLSRG